MKALKPVKSNKEERERHVLFALIEHYIKHGKPIGSETLKDAEFSDLSAATIRNYFMSLEKEGYLLQQHSSGGRKPTDKAFRLYAHEQLNARDLDPAMQRACKELGEHESREIASYLQYAAETLSHLTQSAVFLSAPRFDHDFISSIKLVNIDHSRILCVIVTDFGVIKTEVVSIDKKISNFSAKRMEEYFQGRLTGQNAPENLTDEEEKFSQKLYNELLVRYVVGYTNFNDDEIYRTGFSKLIAYPEFHDAAELANSLSLFENSHSMRLLLRDCSKHDCLKFWIGDDLLSFASQTPNCAILTIPYDINTQPIGAIGLLSSVRIPYKQLFPLLRHFSEVVSHTITRNMYKFKIKYRQPQQGPFSLELADSNLLQQANPLLIEDRCSDKNTHSLRS